MAEMTKVDIVREQLLQLKAALDTRLPNFPQLLRTIHMNLKKDPEIVTLLAPEDINIVIQGLERQKNTILASVAMKKTKSMKSLDLGDL